MGALAHFAGGCVLAIRLVHASIPAREGLRGGLDCVDGVARPQRLSTEWTHSAI